MAVRHPIDKHHHRERLAWSVLIGGFLLCAAFALAIPVGLNSYIQNAKEQLSAELQANQGSVRLNSARGARGVVLAGEAGQLVEDDTRIQTDGGSTASLFITPPDSTQMVARLQVYNNTSVRLEEASTPQFLISDAEQQIDLTLQNGRLRLTLPDVNQRPLALSITTAQSQIEIKTPGTYSIEANGEQTQLTVQEGQAAISAAGESLGANPDERILVRNESPPTGPLAPERNLIQNSNFENGLDNWSAFAWNVELSDQPTGETQIGRFEGEPVLSFRREGVGHADVRVQQAINQDVDDFDVLRLLLTFRIVSQSLSVCGFQGSECPLFVRLDYIDEDGISRIWQQGFYGIGTIDNNNAPGACISCAVVQSGHLQTTSKQLYVFDVDINRELARQGFLPTRYIQSITLIGSGHAFTTEILEATLIAEE